MDGLVFEQYADERGNIHVRVSQEVCMLTKEEEATAIAKFEALKAENAKLRELVGDIWEFGFSNSAGASSVKEWYRVRDELEQRVYEALGVDNVLRTE